MKKKLLSYMLSLVLLLALFTTGMALPVSAAASATLSVANVQAYPGDTITVDVSLNGATSGLQITLEYDPAVLTPEKIQAGSQCPSGWMVVPSNDLTMGRFVAVSGSLKNDTISGVVAQYTYKVNPDAALGNTSLKVVTAIMSDDGTDFNATVSSHGSVTVVSNNPDNPSNPDDSSNPSNPDDSSNSSNPSNPDDSSNSSNSSNSDNSTNSSDSANESKNNPKTGYTDAWMLWMLIILSGGIAVSIAVVKKQKS